MVADDGASYWQIQPGTLVRKDKASNSAISVLSLPSHEVLRRMPCDQCAASYVTVWQIQDSDVCPRCRQPWTQARGWSSNVRREQRAQVVAHLLSYVAGVPERLVQMHVHIRVAAVVTDLAKAAGPGREGPGMGVDRGAALARYMEQWLKDMPTSMWTPNEALAVTTLKGVLETDKMFPAVGACHLAGAERINEVVQRELERVRQTPPPRATNHECLSAQSWYQGDTLELHNPLAGDWSLYVFRLTGALKLLFEHQEPGRGGLLRSVLLWQLMGQGTMLYGSDAVHEYLANCVGMRVWAAGTWRWLV